MEFSEMYPDGINTTIRSFSKALWDIMTTDEIDRIINRPVDSMTHSERRRWKTEKRWLENFRDAFREVDGWEIRDWWNTINIWDVMMRIESPRLFSDIITYMVVNNKEVSHEP